jgi:hypothetical protein
MNYRIHVGPFFGDSPLSAITSTRLLELRAKLQAQTYRRKRRAEDGKVHGVEAKLSPRMVNLVLALVRSILRFAVANGHIAQSPTDRIGRGKLMLPRRKAEARTADRAPRRCRAASRGDREGARRPSRSLRDADLHRPP